MPDGPGDTIACLHVVAAAELQCPMRVLDLFAKQGFNPEQILVRRTGTNYELTIGQRGMSGEKALALLEEVRTLVLVADARLELSPVSTPADA